MSFPRDRGELLKRAEVFWSHVNKSGDCWLWTAAIGTDGYGRWSIQNYWHLRAHRAAWIIAHGDIPDGKWVLHRCDVPLCVKPSHLFLGTVQDNVDDLWNKGKGLSGERHPGAKLDWERVRLIRKLYKRGTAGRELARLFSVDHALIHMIVHGKVWKEDVISTG